MSSGHPRIEVGTVLAQDPNRYGVMVAIDSWGGQAFFVSCQVITHGQRDATTGSHPPLPISGTRGVVVIPRGDDRSGVWLGAISPSLQDASSMIPGLGNLDHTAHYDGGFSWRAPNGTVAEVFADGSSFLLGSVMPQPTRHIVNDGTRVAAPFTAAERNPNPPAAMPFAAAFANGVTVAATAAGDFAVTVHGSTFAMASDGSVTVTPGNGVLAVNGAIHATGDVVRGFGSGDQVTLGEHLHTVPGGGDTSAPIAGT